LEKEKHRRRSRDLNERRRNRTNITTTHAGGVIPDEMGRRKEEEEEEEEFNTSGNWRGKHKSLSRGAGADQP